jgi:hypothetical protein
VDEGELKKPDRRDISSRGYWNSQVNATENEITW